MESGEPVVRTPGWLRTFARKVRGLFGLGMIGGLFGAVGGAGFYLLTSLNRFGLFMDPDFWGFILRNTFGAAVGFFVAGATVSVAFGAALAVTGRNRSLEELPLWQMALLGAGIAGSIPTVTIVTVAGWSALVSTGTAILPATAVLATSGALLTGSLVGLAKGAARRELREAGDEPAALTGAGRR